MMTDIKGLQKTSLIDYPGKICATIFLAGCNFRCAYCYNKDLVLSANKLPTIDEDYLFSFLNKRKNVLDGVCITGGEPTLHKDLPDIIKKIRSLGYLIKLDTNGSNPGMIKRLINERLIDYIAMDIKSSPKKYERVIGVKCDIQLIEESINAIRNSNIDHEFRMTVIPDIIKDQDITHISRWLDGSRKFYLQQFKPTESIINPKLRTAEPYFLERLDEFRKILQKTIKQVEIREA